MSPTSTQSVRLIILCGLPFAGKSTLAEALRQRFGWSVIAIDAVNHERGLGANAAPITLEQWDATYADAYRRLQEALDGGNTVVFDAVSFTWAQREDLRAIAAKRGASPLVIYLDTSASVCRERWLANRRTGARYDVRNEDFEHVVAHFEPPVPDERSVVYDQSAPPDGWIERIFASSAEKG